MATVPRPDANSRTTTLVAIVVVILALYFARLVLIPFALALLISFLLAPLVVRLRRLHLGRVPSVLCVVGLAFLLVAGIGAIVSVQISALAHNLPEYQENIQKKIHAIRNSSSGTLDRLSGFVRSFNKEMAPVTNAETPAGEVKPVQVEIHKNVFSPGETLRDLLGPLINVLVIAGIVFIFVIFILFQREDLRDRLIRLMGARRINMTTKAMDDAGDRLGRFLLMQLGLNAGYGVLTGLGLFFMGVPNPVLWGVLAALFRYIPYLGIWLAACLPAAVALATNPGWLQPLGIFGLYFGIDVVAVNFLEPMLYGSSTGISPMAILVASTFWTWLWGPIGLLLATPLTVCLVVIGHHVPSLEFLSILLGDKPVLTPDKRFYQRLLAMDLDEATEISEEFLKEKKSLELLYDQVIIPALILTEEDRHRGKLDEEQQRFIVENVRLLVEDFAERAEKLISDGKSEDKSSEIESPSESVLPSTEASILLMPARDEIDELAAVMFAQLLAKRGIAVRSISAAALTSERIENTGDGKIQIVCVSAIPPFGYLHARYLCKRLRAQFPETKVVAAILNQGDPQLTQQREPRIPADEIVTSLRQAVSVVQALASCTREQPQQTALRS